MMGPITSDEIRQIAENLRCSGALDYKDAAVGGGAFTHTVARHQAEQARDVRRFLLAAADALDAGDHAGARDAMIVARRSRPRTLSRLGDWLDVLDDDTLNFLRNVDTRVL